MDNPRKVMLPDKKMRTVGYPTSFFRQPVIGNRRVHCWGRLVSDQNNHHMPERVEMVSPDSIDRLKPEFLKGNGPPNNAAKVEELKRFFLDRGIPFNVSSLTSFPVSPKPKNGRGRQGTASCRCKDENQLRLEHAEAWGLLDDITIEKGKMGDFIKLSEQTGLLLVGTRTDDTNFNERPKRYPDVDWMEIGDRISNRPGAF